MLYAAAGAGPCDQGPGLLAIVPAGATLPPLQGGCFTRDKHSGLRSTLSWAVISGPFGAREAAGG